MEHSNCGWTCECAGKTVRSLENTCHTWALLRWCFMKRRYIKCTYLYLYMFIVHCCSSSMVRQCWLDFVMDAEQMNCLHLHHLIPRYGIHTPLLSLTVHFIELLLFCWPLITFFFYFFTHICVAVPTVFWHCWFDVRKGASGP